MKRFLLSLAICGAVLSGQVVAQDVQPSSQGAPTLSSLEIALWPEYDRPEVLVIYRGVFAPGVSLPIPAEFRLPARVGQPTAVAYVDEEGRLFNQPYTSRLEGDWLVVSFELAVLGFQLEYYDELPVDSHGRRSYTYTYTADYPTTALGLEFQVPPNAGGFTLDPPADSVVPEADGLVYHRVEPGSMSQNDTRIWSFVYQKDSAALTIEALAPAETPAPTAPPVSGSADNSADLLFLVGFVGLLGVGAGAFWLGRRVQPPSQTAPPPPKRRTRRDNGRRAEPVQQELSSAESSERLHCHKCGTQLRSDSQFCHRCGAKVRRSRNENVNGER